MAERDKQASGLGYMMMPTSSTDKLYSVHVGMRTDAFLLLVFNVAHLLLKYGLPGPYSKYLSDKATVQVDSGVYGPSFGKIDAAHLCNTSFQHDQFLTAYSAKHGVVPLEVAAYARDLYISSGATTPQLKVNNVGPDKVIDNYQVDFKNYVLGQVEKAQTAPDYVAMRKLYLSNLKKLLEAKYKTKKTTSSTYDGYGAATSSIASQGTAGPSWSDEAEVASLALDVEKLPGV